MRPLSTAALFTACAAAFSSAAAQTAGLPAQPKAPGPIALTPPPPSTVKERPEGMVWVPGGEFLMGSTDPLARPDEAPVHRVRVDGFWIDSTEVTNAQFAAFVKATGYKTVAERPVDWEQLKKQVPEGTPKPADEMLKPGSLVFTPPKSPVDLRAFEQWWTWTHGADWRHPEGPGSSIEGKENYPVVHIAFEDAMAYCKWSGKSLPTEAQWEFAARGGLAHAINTWGNEAIDPKRANTWQGHFPDKDTPEDGYSRTAPVKSFPPNAFGLFDMAGNVWEWCSDLYRPDTYARRVLASGGPGGKVADVVIINPTGPERSYDARNPHAPESRVQRGGSFLCSDSYCASYRPSARMACSPDTGMQHLGFRCMITQTAWEKLVVARSQAQSAPIRTPAAPETPSAKP